jgi:transcriptional regulator with XRE-family HTH domain
MVTILGLCYDEAVQHPITSQPVGHLLREWRTRRRMSQLDLASEADISTRHLSFLETGRSSPSREMLLHLAEQLAIPLRERNVLLVAAGYAPVFPERPLDDPALRAARDTIEQVLKGHEPYPALAIDRHWTLVASNKAIRPLLAGVAPTLLLPPVNVLRVSLHPQGLASRIANLPEWRAQLLARLRRQIDLTADPVLVKLLRELLTYPAGRSGSGAPAGDRANAEVVIPMQLDTEGGRLELLSTIMMFGTPVDITLSELALEFLFPANAETAAILHSYSHSYA